jgi:hypothetical protein
MQASYKCSQFEIRVSSRIIQSVSHGRSQLPKRSGSSVAVLIEAAVHPLSCAISN